MLAKTARNACISLIRNMHFRWKVVWGHRKPWKYSDIWIMIWTSMNKRFCQKHAGNFCINTKYYERQISGSNLMVTDLTLTSKSCFLGKLIEGKKMKSYLFVLFRPRKIFASIQKQSIILLPFFLTLNKENGVKKILNV